MPVDFGVAGAEPAPLQEKGRRLARRPSKPQGAGAPEPGLLRDDRSLYVRRGSLGGEMEGTDRELAPLAVLVCPLHPRRRRIQRRQAWTWRPPKARRPESGDRRPEFPKRIWTLPRISAVHPR